MVFLGKTKMNKTRQISLIKEVADLFEIEEGEYVKFYAQGGEIIIRKDVRKYDGFDFETELIKDRVVKKERDLIENMYDYPEVEDTETRKEAARETFLKDQERKRRERISE